MIGNQRQRKEGERMITDEELKNDMRVLNSYYWSKAKRDIIKTTHICFTNNVAQVFEKLKHRGTVVALAKEATWCDPCGKTACWDYGKAICCNERRIDK